MGLAASQARLLSITSRMSDNELRSQLINNAKMRLTSDSARVSDEYVAALNATQLMFTNFDTQGNEKYQALTFNSLTAYSSYNNQYGIVNNSGEILVSASDADKFNAAGGSLEKFLESYGLEQTTDYFSTLAKSQEFLSKGVGWYDNNGNWQQFDASAEELQAMYEGLVDANGVVHYGQADSLNSLEYGQYESLVSNYRGARDIYNEELKKAMRGFLNGETNIILGNTFTHNNKTFEDYYLEICREYDKFSKDNSKFNPTTASDYANIFKEFAAKIGLNDDMALNDSADAQYKILKDFYLADKNQNTGFLEILRLNLAIASATEDSTVTIANRFKPNTSTMWAELDESGKFLGYKTPTLKYLIKTDNENDTFYEGLNYYGKLETNKPTDPNVEYREVYDMGEFNDAYTYKPVYLYTDENGVEQTTYEGAPGYDELKENGALTPCAQGDIVYELTAFVKREDIMEALKILYETFRNNIMDNISSEPFKKNEEIKKARANYEKAAAELADFIYGNGKGQEIISQMAIPDYEALNLINYLDQPSWVLSTNIGYQEFLVDGHPTSKVDYTHFNPFNKDYQTTFLKEGMTTGNNYQVVKDAFLLDCLFEHYGDPVYTWIDKDNKDENAQAKATWYSNLFARMQQGFKVIGEGLRNNQEWLQFAFESGFVHMEQVNKSSEWVSTIYSNCSNITESTIDVNVTLAEAKYNREMAKIEAKDKKYDIELKNIDTEHESLKNEMESIKKVIESNIKNNMKLFQNG